MYTYLTTGLGWGTLLPGFSDLAVRHRERKMADDIEDVMREEKSRGKRPVDTKARRQRQERLMALQEALKARTEREFVEAIRELGYADDPEKLRQALKIWRSSFSA
jgi:hypothetical protein